MACGVGGLKYKQTWFSFPENHGTTTKKASYFLNHVDLGVIELKALKTYTRRRRRGGGGKRKKVSSDDGDDWTKKKKK